MGHAEAEVARFPLEMRQSEGRFGRFRSGRWHFRLEERLSQGEMPHFRLAVR